MMEQNYLNELLERYPALKCVKEDIYNAYKILEECFSNGNKLLVAGNGGSAADSEHIVGELMKGFVKSRKMPDEFTNKLKDINYAYGSELGEKLQGALPAIALTVHNGLNTAYLNDVDGQLCYAQEVNGYGIKNDVFLGISTSGNSKNILMAAVTAKAKGMKVIGLTGKGGGILIDMCDACIAVSEDETYKVQELHLPIYHTLCLMLEERFFGGKQYVDFSNR